MKIYLKNYKKINLNKITEFAQKRHDDANCKYNGNGVRFDIGILENAIVACGCTEMPWNFRNERDVRTLVSFAPSVKENYPFVGVEHDPISDCIHQINYCSAIYNLITCNNI